MKLLLTSALAITGAAAAAFDAAEYRSGAVHMKIKAQKMVSDIHI